MDTVRPSVSAHTCAQRSWKAFQPSVCKAKSTLYACATGELFDMSEIATLLHHLGMQMGCCSVRSRECIDLTIQLPNLTVSLRIPFPTTARTPLKSAGDCLRYEESQRWNRVRHMSLRSSGCREGRNLRVAKTFLVERRFFWSRHG